ncbi:MAG: hypothetical protein HY710_10055 [Candidatus Latescibacteria bacterium]|nr:hypothetical protein [Candidatus Latescibacterota bacterium]
MTKRELAERLFTLLAIASLWPTILGWTHPIYKVILIVVLAILCLLLVNRFRRINQVFHDHRPKDRNSA